MRKWAASILAATIAAAMQAGSSFAAPDAHTHCLRALAPFAVGDVADAAKFEPADCVGENASPTFRYDVSAHLARLARPVAAGEIVPAYPQYDARAVHAGGKLHLVILAGPVRVEREVEAIQPAKPGQRLFVRAGDGAILSVTYAGAGQ